MNFRNGIPNAITLANLLSGAVGVILVQKGLLVGAALAILLAALFDLLDGLVARLLHAASPIGKELDSLADLVSFGLLPSLIVFHYLSSSSWAENFPLLPYSAFLIVLFAALRLARFNVDTEQEKGFKGLPVPANAMFWSGIPLTGWQNSDLIGWKAAEWTFKGDPLAFLIDPLFLLGATLVLSFLMISSLPLLAFKFEHWGWKGNESRILTFIGSLALFAFFLFRAIPMIVLLYLIGSLFHRVKPNS